MVIGVWVEAALVIDNFDGDEGEVLAIGINIGAVRDETNGGGGGCGGDDIFGGFFIVVDGDGLK